MIRPLVVSAIPLMVEADMRTPIDMEGENADSLQEGDRCLFMNARLQFPGGRA